jgi:hypothetical protein
MFVPLRSKFSCKLTDLILKVILFGAETICISAEGVCFGGMAQLEPRENGNGNSRHSSQYDVPRRMRQEKILDVRQKKKEREHPSDDRRYSNRSSHGRILSFRAYFAAA